MFVHAVEQVGRYTRPIHSILRGYGTNSVWPGAATLFFVNSEGVAITCRHVAEQLLMAEKLNQQYLLFSQARFRLKRDEYFDDNLRELELQFNYFNEAVVQARHTFVGCFDRISGFECHLHPTADLAIIRFKGFTQIHYQGHAQFIEDDQLASPGRFLCRLGFPFPEFTNYTYNYQTDDIEWTREGNPRSPAFPIEGIITRLIVQHGQVNGIELSSPGLRGQSGGPLFDPDGRVYGMQSSTRHLHLGFDLENHEVQVGPGMKKVTNMPFLHVGQCVHATVIKAFLREHGVHYFET